jgi:hypothetical protein
MSGGGIPRERVFEVVANSAVAWRVVAYELIAAANILELRDRNAERRRRMTPFERQRFHVDGSSRVFPMLYAFALEALLKCLWIAQGNPATEKDALHPGFRKDGHELARWWARATLPALDREAKELVKLLVSYIEIGRYPIRRRPQDEGGLILVHSIKQRVIVLLRAVDDRISQQMPGTDDVIARRNLASLGIRRQRIRPAKTGKKRT